MKKNLEFLVLLILVLSRVASSAQTAEESRTLVINSDCSGKVAVLKMGDKTYVDLNRLVQIGRGSLIYDGDRLVLTISCVETNSSAGAAGMETTPPRTLGREFAKAAIEEISLMREWASALASAVQNGFPVTDHWVANYRAQAQTGLAIASSTVSTDGDRNGLELLRKEFEWVQEWSDKLLAARKSMNAAKYALSPGELHNDPLSQKIVSCAHFLGQMMASGNFNDDPSCR